MSDEQGFWTVDCKEGEPDLLVCMLCLNEVFWRKMPVFGCPTCHRVSTFEAFTFDAIRDWGSEELITKASRAKAGAGTKQSNGMPGN